MLSRFKKFAVTVLIFQSLNCFAQSGPYPDQFYTIKGTDLFSNIDTSYGITEYLDGTSIQLKNDKTEGFAIFSVISTNHPFNRGLPSWNGKVTESNSGFKVYIRFIYGSGWSPWLTVGYWKENIWQEYGTTQYGEDRVDIDYVKLYTYKSKFQFKVEIVRQNCDDSSPTLNKLSFFASDSRTEEQIDYDSILNDNPEEIFIPTTFLYQYSIDSEIGGRICSPTSVSMVLLSYDIDVDPLQFAWETYDTYWEIFGVWPRVVQNASEYGLDGAVTRYRTWSEARDVLAEGGRIVMSVGEPLYSGHLMMLAGFTEDGKPIVHDPAKNNGYSYDDFDKSLLSKSWFDKGGIAYTFFKKDTTSNLDLTHNTPNSYELRSFPNPFNSSTNIVYYLPDFDYAQLKIFDIRGKCVYLSKNKYLEPGFHSIKWNGVNNSGNELSSGIYFCVISYSKGANSIIKLSIVK